MKTTDPIQAKFLEITSDSCAGDITLMCKKFSRKCKKEEILKPVYAKRFHLTKRQKERKKHCKAIYKQKQKEIEEALIDDNG